MRREEVQEGASPACTEAMFYILLVLADHDAHGYRIMQEVNEQTDGSMRLGPGTLYRSIRQLLVAGMIEECEERRDPTLDDKRRRYYRITNTGRQVAMLEAERLARMLRVAQDRRLLRGESFRLLVSAE